MTLAIFLILICTFSLVLYETMDVTIHNLYSDIELTSPVCFCDNGTYDEYPVDEMDNGTMMKIGFRFDLAQSESGGILMYEVQRKGDTKSDHQLSIDIISTKAVEDASK
jgi:hypothetical protein